jgi:acylglycerol lipase
MNQQSVSTTQEKVEGASGLQIFFRSWRPASKSRGVVVIIPGFNAHSAYYGWVAEQLVADGRAVYALDLRGRGNSDGERFYVETFEDYVRDVEVVMAVVKIPRTGPARFHAGSQRRRRRLLSLYS